MNVLNNSVRLIGIAGGDPEVRMFDGNKKMARVNIAVHDNYRAGSTDRQAQTQWHRLVFWGKQAELAEKLIHKSSRISIEGRLNSGSYVAADGSKRYTTEIVVNEIEVSEP